MLGVAGWTGTQALTTALASVELTFDGMAEGIIALGGLWLFGTTLVTAATVTVRLSRDANGDELICPDFVATLNTGRTTATDWTAIIDYARIPFFGATRCFVHVRTNAGTLTLTEAKLTYSAR